MDAELQKLQNDLVEALARVAVTDTYMGRTSLLPSPGDWGLRRDEGGKRTDLMLMVTGLFRVGGPAAVAGLTDNAIAYVPPSYELGDELRALRSRIVRLLPWNLLAELYGPRGGIAAAAAQVGLAVGAVGPDAPADAAWRRLWDEARLRGKLWTLVESASSAHPDARAVAELKAAAQRSSDLGRLPEGAPVLAVSSGLFALAELLASPEVKARVAEFRTRFLTTSKQIEVLGSYKDLHDFLHTLQFRCHSFVAQEAKRAPKQQVDWAALANPLIDLVQAVTDMKAVAARAVLPAEETRWIAEVEAAQTSLSTAVETLSAEHLEEANWRLSRLVRMRPTQINHRLNRAALDLTLPELAEAMSTIHARLADAGVDPDKARQFQETAASLNELSETLRSFVREHDGWQEIEAELRFIAEDLPADMRGLARAWPDLRAKVEALSAASPDALTLLIQREAERLTKALEGTNTAQVEVSFSVYRRQVGQRFFNVDLTLKRLCDDLRKVGRPIFSVLSMMG